MVTGRRERVSGDGCPADVNVNRDEAALARLRSPLDALSYQPSNYKVKYETPPG
jgi:hypothetical protein